MSLKLFNQSGDTLIEVAVAVAILGVVLTSSYVLSNRGLQLSQTAKERVELVAAAQEQAEALTNFRDTSTWPDFVAAIGILSATDCDDQTAGTQICFHMTKASGNWVPTPGPQATSGVSLPPGNTIWIEPSVESGDSNTYNFKIGYQALPAFGKVLNRSIIYLKLTNLDPLK